MKKQKTGILNSQVEMYFVINPIPAGLWNDVKCRDRAIMALFWFEPILKHENIS